MFSFCKIRGLARAFCSASSTPGSAKLGDLVPGLSQFGRFGTPEGRFLGGIEGFGTFSWRDLKFGTRRRANLEVWYPQKPPGQIVTRRFCEAGEPNRRSWQKSGFETYAGYQTPDFGRRVPNPQSWRGGHQVPVPEEEQLITVTRPGIGSGSRRCRRDDDRGPRPFRL